MKKTLVLLFLFATVAPMLAQVTAENNKYAKIDSLLNYLYTNKRFMGSVAIREKGTVVFSKAYGYADLNAGLPANENTKYKIGSITKMFTAAVVFQLIEEKKLTLETKLDAYFPKIKNADTITIANMMNHSSGIYNFTDDTTLDLTKPTNRRDMVEQLYNYEPAFFPGEKQEYSNSNYLLLGYIIQDITKKTYKENITKRIIEKAGLKNTYYYSKINPRKNEAYSYELKNGDWIPVPEWHESITGAAGALQSTPEDLTKFITELFAGKIISKESLTEMTKLNGPFGKGIIAFPFGERKLLGHNGSIEGFESALAFYPKDNMAISVITNGLDYNFNDIMLGILSCYYKLPYRFPVLNTVVVSEDILKKYQGKYNNPQVPYTVNIEVVEGKLQISAYNQGTFFVEALNDTEFIHVPSGMKLKFNPGGFDLLQNGNAIPFKKQ